MFKKNLKALSLFLILLVLMIGAISAVSAEDCGNSDVTISDASNVTVTQADADAAASEANAVTVTVVTEGTSTGSYMGVYVPDGTPVNGDVTFDAAIYSAADKDKAVANVVVDNTALTSDAIGVYKGTLSITAGANLLENGTTYYMGITVAADAVATYTTDGGVDLVSKVKEDTTLFVPFTYVAKDSVSADSNVTVPYSEDWEVIATVVGIADDENVAVNVKGPEGSTVNVDVNVVVKNGKVNLTQDADVALDDLKAGVYTITFTTATGNTAKATLTVQGVNVTLAAELDENVVEFDGPANLTVGLSEDVSPTIVVNAINQATGVTSVIDGLTYDGTDKVWEGKMTSGGKPLPVGTYLVTVSATLDNYAFNSAALTYTVDPAETEIEADPNPVYVVDGVAAEIKFVVLTNVTDVAPGIDVADGEITAVLRDEAGNAVQALNVVIADKKVEVPADAIKDGYYVTISYANAAGNFKSSTVTVPLYIRKGTELALTDENGPVTDVDFNYGEEGPVITVTLTDKSGNVLKFNTTVAVVVDDEDLLATVDLVEGVGKLNLTDLELDADDHLVTFSYVDEDDVYMPAEADLGVDVYPVQTYILNVNTTDVTYDVNSEEVIAFNLTLASNSSAIAPYTGDLSYENGELDPISGDPIVYTIPVVDGIATIPVSELEGLIYGNGPIIFTFYVDGNEVSNEVDVTVTPKLLNAEIFTENVTTTEATGFIIDGFVTNVTGGKVQVDLFADPDDLTSIIATVYADVDEDIGYFAASFGGLAEGNYTAVLSYDDTDATFPAANDPKAIVNVTVAGEAPEPTPTNVSYATVLTIDPFNETEGAGKSLVGRLTLEDGTPVIGMHILLNLTRVSDGASKVYTTTTDYNGEFQFPINLGAGEYTAQATFEGVTISSTNVTYNASTSPVTPFSVTKNGTQPTNETTVVIIPTPYVGTYGTPGNFTVQFLLNGTPIVGIPGIEITLTRVSSGASKTYSWFVTDYNGEINMPIELGAGDYTAHIKFNSRTEPYVIDGAEADSTITVKAAA